MNSFLTPAKQQPQPPPISPNSFADFTSTAAASSSLPTPPSTPSLGGSVALLATSAVHGGSSAFGPIDFSSTIGVTTSAITTANTSNIFSAPFHPSSSTFAVASAPSTAGGFRAGEFNYTLASSQTDKQPQSPAKTLSPEPAIIRPPDAFRSVHDSSNQHIMQGQ